MLVVVVVDDMNAYGRCEFGQGRLRTIEYEMYDILRSTTSSSDA